MDLRASGFCEVVLRPLEDHVSSSLQSQHILKALTRNSARLVEFRVLVTGP